MNRADFHPVPFRLALSEVAALAEALSCLDVRRSFRGRPRSRCQFAFRLTAPFGKSPPGAVPAADFSLPFARVSA